MSPRGPPHCFLLTAPHPLLPTQVQIYTLLVSFRFGASPHDHKDLTVPHRHLVIFPSIPLHCSLSRITTMLSSALLAFSLGPSSFSSGSVSSLDLETDDDLPSTPSPNPSLALLPPEVRRQILAEAFVGRYEPFLVDAQFQPVETLCRLCTFRTLSLVSREWHEVVQELFLREIVVEKQVQNEQLVGALRRDPRLGRRVRNLDASLRSLNNAMPELVSIDSSVAYVEAEAEGLRAASIDK